MSFSIVYVGGGQLDKVKTVGRLESGRLDAPFMPTLTEPLIYGRRLSVPGQIGTVTDSFSLDFDTEMLAIAIGANKHESRDHWSLKVGGDIVAQTIFTKQLPEGLNFMVVKPVPANTPIELSFSNEGGAAKVVWYNVQFLKGAD